MGQEKKSAMTMTMPSEKEIVLTRVFDAPRALVFQAYTDPALIPRWWGPRGVTTTVDQMDVRPGGIWRYIMRGEDGKEGAFNGVYHEITPPERVVCTFEFEGNPGHILLATVTFDEHDGKTTVTDSSVFETVEDRDGMLNSGMVAGATDLYDRFEELLATLSREGKATGADE